MKNTEVSEAAKLLTSHLVAILAASVTYGGMLQLAGLLGTAVGKRLAPVVVPLITSTSAGRRLLGWSLLAAGASVTGGVVGAGGSAIVVGTFVGVEKLVADAIKDEDWTKLDAMADELESAVYGTVSAIKQAFFGRPPSVTGYDADEEQAALH